MVKPIPDWGETKLFPTDSRSIVTSVLLAVCFSLTMQVTERLDAFLFGGLNVPLGFFGAAIWWPSSCAFYGVIGALLTANFNPIVANLTATNPLAPLFFLMNTLACVPEALLFKYFKKPGKPMGFWTFWLIAWQVEGIMSNMPQLVLWIAMLHLPMPLIAYLWLVAYFATGVGAAIGFFLARSIVRSGLLVVG